VLARNAIPQTGSLQTAARPSVASDQKPACKAGAELTLVEPILHEQGLDSINWLVCSVRQSGMPKELRRVPPS